MKRIQQTFIYVQEAACFANCWRDTLMLSTVALVASYAAFKGHMPAIEEGVAFWAGREVIRASCEWHKQRPSLKKVSAAGLGAAVMAAAALASSQFLSGAAAIPYFWPTVTLGVLTLFPAGGLSKEDIGGRDVIKTYFGKQGMWDLPCKRDQGNDDRDGGIGGWHIFFKRANGYDDQRRPVPLRFPQKRQHNKL